MWNLTIFLTKIYFPLFFIFFQPTLAKRKIFYLWQSKIPLSDLVDNIEKQRIFFSKWAQIIWNITIFLTKIYFPHFLFFFLQWWPKRIIFLPRTEQNTPVRPRRQYSTDALTSVVFIEQGLPNSLLCQYNLPFPFIHTGQVEMSLLPLLCLKLCHVVIQEAIVGCCSTKLGRICFCVATVDNCLLDHNMTYDTVWLVLYVRNATLRYTVTGISLARFLTIFFVAPLGEGGQ